MSTFLGLDFHGKTPQVAELEAAVQKLQAISAAHRDSNIKLVAQLTDAVAREKKLLELMDGYRTAVNSLMGFMKYLSERPRDYLAAEDWESLDAALDQCIEALAKPQGTIQCR